jgi:hypothetical protein
VVKIEQVVGGFEKITEKYRGSSTKWRMYE